MKDAVSAQVKLLQSNKNDNKYRNIIDLIMLRVNAALQELYLPYDDAVSADVIYE